MTIYDRIKHLREEQGLSQQALAEKVGFKTASAVNKIELGLRDINQSKVVAFAKALNTTPAYLMGWEDNEESPAEDEELNRLLKITDGLSNENIEKLIEYGYLLLTSQKSDEHPNK